MQRNLARVVSRQPLRDISVVTWFAFSMGCHQFGFHFFWACCANLLLAGFIRLLVGAPRPFMFDSRLRPLTDRYETSHGFPSLETHMATVVVGWWVESIDARGGMQSIARLLAVIYICFVGFTRVYACSRFVHQVLLSVITGAVGLFFGWRLSVHLNSFDLLFRHHVRGTIVVLIIALGFVSYHVENNTSELMGIKKQEYVRVLANIINESGQTQNATFGASERDNRDSLWGKVSDAPTDGRITSSGRSRQRLLEEHRDSFYFLHKTIERRAAEKAAVQRNNSFRGSQFASRGGSFDGEVDGVGSYGERRGTGRRRYGNSERFSAAVGQA
ncbi:unnamed protein product [Ascophyllum nodosum]